MSTYTSPPLPPGHRAELPGRGTTFYREVAGPPGAPVLLLLHGWTASADLNFHGLFDELGETYRVIAPDHRGHGRGIRADERVTLEDCADDASALCLHLGIERVTAVGYSMGGTIAQILWHRHPDLVDAMVLCATASRFTDGWKDSAVFGLLGGLSRAGRKLPESFQTKIGMRLINSRRRELDEWVTAELERHDWAQVGEAGLALGRYDSNSWISAIDVPTSVIVTLHDDVVDPIRQLRMGRAIPGADLQLVEGNHAVCSAEPERFARVLLTAVGKVGVRARAREAIVPRARVAAAGQAAPSASEGFSVWRPSPQPA
jgi:pimeloyl-ACP methyl ester carboxylesterase